MLSNYAQLNDGTRVSMQTTLTAIPDSKLSSTLELFFSKRTKPVKFNDTHTLHK